MSLELEQKLWRGEVQDPAEWVEVGRYIVARLTEYLGHQIEIYMLEPDDAFTFACRIHGRSNSGPLAISWRGYFGIEPLHGGPLDWLSLTIVPFVLGQRLKVGDDASSTLELVFERRPDGLGEWKCQGWATDECGEWEGVDPV